MSLNLKHLTLKPILFKKMTINIFFLEYILKIAGLSRAFQDTIQIPGLSRIFQDCGNPERRHSVCLLLTGITHARLHLELPAIISA